MRHEEDAEGQVGDQNGWEQDQGAIVKGGTFQFDRVFDDSPETYRGALWCCGKRRDSYRVVERIRSVMLSARFMVALSNYNYIYRCVCV